MAIPAKRSGPHFNPFTEFIIKALPFFALVFMKVMIIGVIFFRAVTLCAKGIPLKFPFQAVGIMAITTTYIPHVHFALCEGTVFIILLQELPVDEIIWRSGQLGDGIA
jgi:hypothetical protein